MNEYPILVLGATGTQGGAVIDALLAQGLKAIAYVRDADSEAAHALVNRGVSLATGQLDDVEALCAAMTGVSGVFSVPIVGFDDDPGLELRAGRAVVAAAEKADVPMFVHSSVARAGDHENFVGWDEGRWWVRYWEDKASLNKHVRNSRLRRWCILKPVVLMENYLPPKVYFMTPHLPKGQLITAMSAETRLDHVAAADVGIFAAAAFADPDRFSGQDIDLAGDTLTMREVAVVFREVVGARIEVQNLSPEEALAAGLMQMSVDGHQWDEVEGYKVDIPAIARWGLPLTTFRQWVTAHRGEFDLPVSAKD